MIRKLVLWRLAKQERRLGESLDYLRHVLAVSPRSFFKLAKAVPLTSHRRALPADAYHVARLVATKEEDCGTCVRIEVNLAKADGVPRDVLKAAVSGDPDALPEELADVYRFAEAVVRKTGEEGPFRERLRERYGEEGLVELALGIAACRIYPVTKRALGYATSCSLVPVEV